MPVVINPDQVDFPHFSPETIAGTMLAYLRRAEHSYQRQRFAAELDLYNEACALIHSLDYRIFTRDQKRSELYVEQVRVGVVTQPSDNEGFEGGASLFKKPGRPIVDVVGPNLAERRRVEAEIESVVAELKQLREKRAALQEQARPLHARLAAMKKVLNAVVVSGRPLRTVPPPRTEKAPPLDKLYATVAELRVSLAAIEAAPLPPDVAKARVRAWVEGLSRPPYAHNALDREGIIDLPHVAVGDTFQPDILGLVAFVCKDALIAKCEAMIDQAAGSDGLSDEERAARRRATSEKLIAAERLAEAVAWAKLQAGETVDLAPDASPAAILSLQGE